MLKTMYKNKIVEDQSNRDKSIKTIINTLHEKSLGEQHSKRSSEICRKIGESIRLSESEISKLEAVALLHDIGKIAINEGILNKPGKLKEQEWDEIRKHPEIGYRILNTSYEFSELADCILAHHERWDGRGYPQGLKGENIPLISRIIAIADSYDAMTSDRPYRKALSIERAVLEIIKNSGTQFDPEIAKLFIEKVLGKEMRNNGGKSHADIIKWFARILDINKDARGTDDSTPVLFSYDVFFNYYYRIMDSLYITYNEYVVNGSKRNF